MLQIAIVHALFTCCGIFFHLKLFFAVEFCKFLKYTRKLRFDEMPDYAFLRQMFKDLFFRAGFR
jgi:hypothetical protein